nr:hypothetical protein [Tanacetum cinerariifolium]
VWRGGDGDYVGDGSWSGRRWVAGSRGKIMVAALEVIEGRENCGNDDDVVGEGGVVEMVWRWQRDDEGVDGWWLYRDCGGSRSGMAINHG